MQQRNIHMHTTFIRIELESLGCSVFEFFFNDVDMIFTVTMNFVANVLLGETDAIVKDLWEKG